MSRRQREGLQLYTEGHVSVEYWDEELILFKVRSSKDPNLHYVVSVNGDSWRCLCGDYHHRWQREYGSFSCKHMVAAFLLFAEKK